MNPEQPLVSIIIVSYNSIKDIGECLSSLQETIYPNFEVIMIDNASKDGSASYVRKVHPWIKVIENSRNSGFAEGCNIGVKYAKGDLLVFLNPDTMVDRNWLDELVRVILSDNAIGSCGSKILFWDKKYIQSIGGAYNPETGYTVDLLFGKRDDIFSSKKPLSVFYCCGAAFLVRKDVFREIGGFDNDYFLYFDEVDLGWRIRLLGYENYTVPTSIVYHKIDPFKAHSAKYRFLVEKNSLESMIKCYELKNLFRFGATVVFFRSFAFILFILSRKKQYAYPILRGILNTIHNFKEIWIKRQIVQHYRVQSDSEIICKSHLISFPQLLHMFLSEVRPFLE
jgi:GT2 family glycosyltransferase